MSSFNTLISEPRRKELYQAGETMKPEDVKPGRVVAGPMGGIKQVSHFEEHSHRSLRQVKDVKVTENRVYFNDGSWVRGPEAVSNNYRDITSLAYKEIGAN